MKRIKVFLVTLTMLVFLVVIFINKPTSKFKTVEEHIKEGNTIAFMQQEKDGSYKKVDDIPYGYDFNSKKSICSNNATPTWENGKLKINNLTTKNTACYLYFDRNNATETLEALGLKSNGTTGNITGPACDNDSNCGDTTVKRMNQNGLYYAGEDNDGASYIFRGTINNNWVKFGQTSNNEDIWWRIIRFNGDGTIRLIYAGKGNAAPNNNGENAIENQAYNAAFNDNTYVGFYNQNGLTTAYPAAHEGTNPSDIAKSLNTWFAEITKLSTNYIKYIDENAGFCNDRTIANSTHGTNGYTNKGFGSEYTWYAAFDRVAESDSSNSYNKTEQKPTLKCTNKARDLYTWKDHTKEGNKILENPVGLITMDEAILAGGFMNQTNSSYWLYAGSSYWTITPTRKSTSDADVFVIVEDGSIGSYRVNNTNLGVRPVINLKADTKFKASTDNGEWGTKENPYIVEVTE